MTTNQRTEPDAALPPSAIDNREDGPQGAPARDELMRRIDVARALEPPPHELHCRDCWHKGRNAAIRAILGA
jgi:hypothetical protein